MSVVTPVYSLAYSERRRRHSCEPAARERRREELTSAVTARQPRFIAVAVSMCLWWTTRSLQAQPVRASALRTQTLPFEHLTTVLCSSAPGRQQDCNTDDGTLLYQNSYMLRWLLQTLLTHMDPPHPRGEARGQVGTSCVSLIFPIQTWKCLAGNAQSLQRRSDARSWLPDCSSLQRPGAHQKVTCCC